MKVKTNNTYNLIAGIIFIIIAINFIIFKIYVIGIFFLIVSAFDFYVYYKKKKEDGSSKKNWLEK